MAYNFKITFPGGQRVTLSVLSQTEADDMERALIVLKADYVIKGPKWIGGSFQMTPAAHEVLDRMAPVQTIATVSLADVPSKFTLDRIENIVGVNLDSTT
jgi:hypothetical protein